MAINGGKILSYLELDTSRYTSAMAYAQQQAELFAGQAEGWRNRLGALGLGMTQVGAALTVGVATPLIGAGVAATKASIDFESAFAGVRKTVDATEAEFGQLRATLLNMSKEIPQSANDLAGIMETAGKMGVDTANLESFTRTIADLGVTTNLTGQEAATLLAQYANVTGMDLTNIDRLGSVIVALGNNTATTERDIANMAQRLSGMAQNLNLTDAQVMGLAATMASLGIEAEMGGSAVSRTMARMQQAVLAGDKSLDAFAKAARVDAKTFAEAFRGDPIQALDLFLAGLSKTKAAGEDVYGVLGEVELSDLRVTDSLLRLTGAGDALTQNISLANQAWADNNALTAEASQRYATTESKLQLARNAVNRLMIALGDKLLPTVTGIIDRVTDFVDGLGELDEGMLQTIITVGLFLAAAGPILTLLGGLVTLFTGPLGLVAALGLGGAALAAVVGNFASVSTAITEADLANRFSGISLSVEDLQRIIGLGIPEPNLDLAKLTEAKATLDAVKSDLNTLQADLDTNIYKLKMGIGDPDTLPDQVSAYTAQVQTYLDQQQDACKLAIGAQFGDTGAGSQIQRDLDIYFAGLNEQAAAKGGELRQAVDDAIADGKIDDQERKTIAKLQQELQEIIRQGTMIQGEMDLRTLKYDIQGTPIMDLKTIQNYQSELQTQTEAARAEMEQAYKEAMAVIDAMEVRGIYNKTEADTYRASALTTYNGNLAYLDGMTAELNSTLVNQVAAGFDGDMQAVKDKWSKSLQNTYAQVLDNFVAAGEDLGAEDVQERLRNALYLNLAFLDANDFVPKELRDQAQEMYDFLLPQREYFERLAQQLGDEAPPYVNEALATINDLLMLADPIGSMLNQVEHSSDEALASGEALGGEVASGIETAKPQAEEAAGQLTQGALTKMASATDAFRRQGGAHAGAYLRGFRLKAEIASPSKAMERNAEYMIQASIRKYASAINDFADAGSSNASAYIESFVRGNNAYASNISNSLAAETQTATEAAAAAEAEAERKRAAAAAARRRQRAAAAAAAEAARQEAELKAIQANGLAILSAENRIGAERLAQLSKQTSALMATIGATSIWYQDTTLDKELSQSNTYWQDAQDRAQAEYDALKARLEKSGTDAQREAAQTAHEDRMAQLKQFARDEAAALKEQYDTQKDIALRWLDTQQELMERELSAKREAANQEDYQAQLADLQKQLRQSKSARERRELQAEIDRMERDEALRQEELQLQQITEGYAALREALQAGLIGLGDLTGDKSLGSLSFGSAGLAALDNISATQLRAVLDSLSASAIPAKGSSAGNTYQIDLRGATVRDDGDIQRIVDEFEARMRSAGR